MPKKTINSEIGIGFDTSKITKELTKLESKLGDISSEATEAQKAANQFRLEQEKIKAATALAKKEIDKEAIALKTVAQNNKASAEAAKAAAFDKIAAAKQTTAATERLRASNEREKTELQRTVLYQKSASERTAAAIKAKELAYRKDALEFRKSQAKIREEAKKTKQEIDVLGSGFGFLRNALIGIGIGATGKAFIDLADRAQFLENRVKVSTSSVEEMKYSLDQLRSISAETGSSLENNAILFQRLAIASEALGATNDDMLALTKTVANLGRLSGSSTEDMKNATRQLAQALGNSKLQAEEFNSVIDQMPALVTVVADEMGYTAAEFGNAVRSGEILSKEVYDALIKKGDRVNALAAKLPLTFSQSSQVLRDSLLGAVDEVNKELRITQNLSGIFKVIAENADLMAVAMKGSAAGVAGLTAAWVVYTAAVKRAAISTAILQGMSGPAGWISLAVGGLAAASAGVLLFSERMEETVDVAEELEMRLLKANDAASALAVQKDAKKRIRDLGDEYVILLGKLEQYKVESQKPGFSVFESDLSIDKIKKDIAAVEKELKKVAEIGNQAFAIEEEVNTQERIAEEKKLAEAQKKNFEKAKKSLETKREAALREFETNKKIFEDKVGIDEKERKLYLQRNKFRYDQEISNINRIENAKKLARQREEESRKKEYYALEEKYKTERQLLLENREKEREIIEQYATGDNLDFKLQRLQDYYIKKLAMLEKSEADEAQAKKDAKYLEDVGQDGEAGAFLQNEFKLRKQYGDKKLKYAVSLGKSLTENMDANNKKQFQVMRAFRYSEALIDGASAINKAYTYAPGPVGFALAAATAVRVGMQLNAIKNTSFGGGGAPPTATGGGEGAGATSASASAVPEGPQFSQSIQVNFDGLDIDDDTLYSANVIRKITEEVAKQIEEGITNVEFVSNG